MDDKVSRTISLTCSNELSDALIREVQAWAKAHGVEIDIVVQDYYMPPSLSGDLFINGVKLESPTTTSVRKIQDYQSEYDRAHYRGFITHGSTSDPKRIDIDAKYEWDLYQRYPYGIPVPREYWHHFMESDDDKQT